MKSATVLVYASSALVAGTLDLALFKQAKPQFRSQFSRHDAFDTSVFTEKGFAYYLNISVGTPGQLQTVQLDTGSSDLFVTSSTAAYCQNSTCMGGTFDSSKSSTSQIVAPDAFNITFMDGSTDFGDLISDVVQVRDRVITNVTLGLARNVDPKGTEQTGLLGLGYSVGEASARNMGIRYPNFVVTLVNTGQIASRLYSLYLSDLGHYGSIVFGGVDAQMYEGDFVTLNCLPRDDDVESFYLIMPNVTMVDENGITTQLINETNRQIGIFDFDSTAWEVEHTVYNKILNLTGFVTSPNASLPIGLCIQISNVTALNFQFRGYQGDNATQAPLRVPLAQMLLPAVTETGPVTDLFGNQYCALAILPSETNRGNVWGDAIMRAGYFVFDLDNGQVSLGQAKHSEESKIVAVQAGPHGLASAINQPPYAQTVQANPPAPFATAVSRKASVSTANFTIGAATISTAMNTGSSESGRSISSVPIAWSNSSAVLSTTSSTLSVISSTTSSTTPVDSNTTSGTS